MLVFSVFATFTCVVCVTAALLISSCNLDLCVQFIGLNDGKTQWVVLGLGSPDDSLVELKKRLKKVHPDRVHRYDLIPLLTEARIIRFSQA